MKDLIDKIDNKILQKKTMAIFGTFFLILTIISAYLFYTSREGFCAILILFFGILTMLAFSQMRGHVDPSFPEWPDPPEK